MIHTQVYGFFQTCLPDQAKEVKEYFPNGKNSIRRESRRLGSLKRSINFLST